MIRYFALMICLFAVPVRAEDFSAWQKLMPITFSGHPAGAETLTNFPALIVFSNTTAGAGFSYDDFKSPPYGDLRFAAADKTTALDFEVESWNTNGLSYAWVRIPELTNNLLIYALWQQAGVVAPPCATNGAAWEGGFRGVWHLSETAPGTGSGFIYRDSTAFTNHGADYVSATDKAGVVNGGQAFDGADDYIGAASHASSVNNNFTISFWVFPTTTHEIDAEGPGYIAGTQGQRYTLGAENGGNVNAGAGISVGNNGVSVYEHGSGYMPAMLVWSGALSGWTHVTVVYQAKQPRLYINGVLVRIGYTSNRGATFPGSTFGGGSYGFFPGNIDEFRVESLSRSSNWIQACHMTMASNNVFCAYGDPSSVGWPVVTNLSAVSETNYMTLTGYLVSTGRDENVSAAVFWGTHDAGANMSGWTHTNWFPGWSAIGPLSTNLTPDEAGKLFYFRFCASNSYGQAWASPALSFIWWAGVHTGTVFSTW